MKKAGIVAIARHSAVVLQISHASYVKVMTLLDAYNWKRLERYSHTIKYAKKNILKCIGTTKMSVPMGSNRIQYARYREERIIKKSRKRKILLKSLACCFNMG
jgi:hypothetical protein